MTIDPLTRKVNLVIYSVWGYDVRADWSISGVREESPLRKVLNKHRIILERSEFPDVVARFSLLSPWLSEPLIVARVSKDGSNIMMPEGRASRRSAYS